MIKIPARFWIGYWCVSIIVVFAMLLDFGFNIFNKYNDFVYGLIALEGAIVIFLNP